jgi:hypothetical protein
MGVETLFCEPVVCLSGNCSVTLATGVGCVGCVGAGGMRDNCTVGRGTRGTGGGIGDCHSAGEGLTGGTAGKCVLLESAAGRSGCTGTSPLVGCSVSQEGRSGRWLAGVL